MKKTVEKLDLYLAPIPEKPDYRPVLPAERQALIEATRNDAVRAQRYCAWDTLLKGLQHSRGLRADDARLSKTGRGKWTSAACGISISHCRTAVAAAIADRAVGVDIEPFTDARYRESLLKRIATEAERALFPALSTERRIAVLWTRKEAAFKRGNRTLFVPIRENAAAENIRSIVIRLGERDYVISIAAGESALRVFEVRGDAIAERTDFEQV